MMRVRPWQRIASRGFDVLRRLRSIRRYVLTSVFQSLVSTFAKGMLKAVYSSRLRRS